MSDAEAPVAFEFGVFRLEPQRRLLSRSDGTPVAVTDKAFDCLVFLVKNAGRLVTKDDLLKFLWPTTFVEENNLYVVISALRRALKDDSATPSVVATIAGRGYQFVAEVRAVDVSAHHREAPPEMYVAAPAGSAHVTKRWKVGLAAGAAFILAIGIGVAVWLLRPAAGPGSSVVRLAVLPFKPLTPNDRNESLELGMAETLIAVLNTGTLSVSPLSSVRRYGGVEQDVLEAGRALGVQAVLEGHIQRDGNRLRVSARLLDLRDGRQVWAQRYDEAFTDIFSVQDTIAAKVRSALAAELGAEGSIALRRYTNDSEAYQLYANGRFHLHKLDVRQALASFQQAAERDPNFALAHVGIAEAYSLLAVFGFAAPHDVFPQARQAIDRALQLAPDLGDAYASLGHVKMQYEHDWPGAEWAFYRALELNPSSTRAHQWNGLYLATRGRFEEGIAELREAQALEPAQPVYGALIGMILMYQRRYDDALQQLRLTLDMDADFPTTNTYLAGVYLRRGEYQTALQHLGRVKILAPGSGGYLGQIHALSGHRAEAVEEINRLRELSKHRYVPAYDIATIFATLEQPDEAFEWLTRAFDERSQLVSWLPWDPAFDALRSDPRYPALVEQLR